MTNAHSDEEKYTPGISVITPTGDRKEALARCQYYLFRQTVLPNEWIIVDDSKEYILITHGDWVDCGFYIKVINKKHSINKSKSFTGNVLTAIENVNYDKIIIFEDDDWYSPNYIEETLTRLKDNDLVGQPNAVYYNIAKNVYKVNGNTKRASFCETAFRSICIPVLQKCLKNKESPFVDQRFWEGQHGKHLRKKLFKGKRLVIGIKGMPGRPGIGIGHSPGFSFRRDNNWEKLKKYIGNEDAAYYIRLKKDGLITHIRSTG